MTSAATAIYTVLAADATLLAAATGGVWDYDAIGRKGLNRTITPTAFTSAGIIKPCVLVKLRSRVVDPSLADDANQWSAARETVEVWLYQDTGYTTVETMRARVYALLHAKQIDGTFQVLWQQDIRQQRDPVLDATVERSDYVAVTRRSV